MLDAAAPAPSGADLLKQRTAIEKQIADRELPFLIQIQTIINGAEVQALAASLQPILDQMGPGHTASMLKNMLNSITAVRQQCPQDIAMHQRTRAL